MHFIYFFLFLKGLTAMSMEKKADFFHMSLTTIEGKNISFNDYKKNIKAYLIVNTASECGYTPQYKELEELHKKYHDQGLLLVGVPCNQFGNQEPGDEKEIKKFCELKYGVTFLLLKKSNVKEPHQSELYSYLIPLDPNKKAIQWNFEKFLLDKEGKLIERFASSIKPSDLTKKIEKTLQ